MYHDEARLSALGSPTTVVMRSSLSAYALLLLAATASTTAGCRRAKPSPENKPSPDVDPIATTLARIDAGTAVSHPSVESMDDCSLATPDEVARAVGRRIVRSEFSKEFFGCTYDFGSPANHDVLISGFKHSTVDDAKRGFKSMCAAAPSSPVAGVRDEACSTEIGGTIRKGVVLATVALLNKPARGPVVIEELLHTMESHIP